MSNVIKQSITRKQIRKLLLYKFDNNVPHFTHTKPYKLSFPCVIHILISPTSVTSTNLYFDYSPSRIHSHRIEFFLYAEISRFRSNFNANFNFLSVVYHYASYLISHTCSEYMPGDKGIEKTSWGSIFKIAAGIINRYIRIKLTPTTNDENVVIRHFFLSFFLLIRHSFILTQCPILGSRNFDRETTIPWFLHVTLDSSVPARPFHPLLTAIHTPFRRTRRVWYARDRLFRKLD